MYQLKLAEPLIQTYTQITNLSHLKATTVYPKFSKLQQILHLLPQRHIQYSRNIHYTVQTNHLRQVYRH